MVAQSLGAVLLVASLAGFAHGAVPRVVAVDGAARSNKIFELPELDMTQLRAKLIELKNSKQKGKARLFGGAAFPGPAPSIIDLQVYAVCSAQHPVWEYLASNQYTTTYDHGGGQMCVVAYEIGYGNNSVLEVDGVALPQVKLKTITDGAGIVVGFLHFFNADRSSG